MASSSTSTLPEMFLGMHRLSWNQWCSYYGKDYRDQPAYETYLEQFEKELINIIMRNSEMLYPAAKAEFKRLQDSGALADIGVGRAKNQNRQPPTGPRHEQGCRQQRFSSSFSGTYHSQQQDHRAPLVPTAGSFISCGHGQPSQGVSQPSFQPPIRSSLNPTCEDFVPTAPPPLVPTAPVSSSQPQPAPAVRLVNPDTREPVVLPPRQPQRRPSPPKSRSRSPSISPPPNPKPEVRTPPKTPPEPCELMSSEELLMEEDEYLPLYKWKRSGCSEEEKENDDEHDEDEDDGLRRLHELQQKADDGLRRLRGLQQRADDQLRRQQEFWLDFRRRQEQPLRLIRCCSRS